MVLRRDDGYLRFLGRYKDMLKVGGESVDPVEIEALLQEHPSVEEAAVIGHPDERLSEVVVAFVRAAGGTARDGEALIGHCQGRVASFKIPRHVLYVEELPLTASGKVRKTELREQASQLLP